MPEQNEVPSQAIEDAGALGLIFLKEHARVVGQNVRLGLELYEKLRKERASMLQENSLRARADMRERFGWSSASDQPGKLTLEWLCERGMVKHVHQAVADLGNRGGNI